MIARAMLTGRLGEYVEPHVLGAKSQTIEGWISLAEFSRLSALLERDEGRVQIVLAFDVDEEGRVVVRGTAGVTICMTCQRCLEDVQQELVADIDIVLVKSEGEAREMLPRRDPVVLVAERMDLVALVEDDLILSLPQDACPQVGRDCPRRPAYRYPAGETEERPFGVLAKLKRDLAGR